MAQNAAQPASRQQDWKPRLRRSGGLAVLLALPLAAGLLWMDSRNVPTGESAAAKTAGIWQPMLAIAITLAVARLTGSLARQVGQPAVIGEIAGGILLGPSVLGLVRPDAQSWLFSEKSLPVLGFAANVGLIFFMFVVGTHLRPETLRGRGRIVAGVSHGSIALPFATGVVVAVVLPPLLVPAGANPLLFALFLGVAFSVTAFPVLARILADHRLLDTPGGRLTIACAAVVDIVAWLALALVTGLTRGQGSGPFLLTLGGAVGLTAILVLVVRPLLRRLAGSRLVTAVILIGLPLSALAADRLGLHLVFGAFLFGVICPCSGRKETWLREKLGLMTALLLPSFFALVGLRTDLSLLWTRPALWGWTALLLAAAMLSKVLGTAASARACGFGWRDSATMGALLSCRGLTELIMLDIGLSLGLLTPALFAVLIVVAVVSTVLTGPLMRLLAGQVLNSQSGKG
jgi:Kef-type K+ transport system membrane component KefB